MNVNRPCILKCNAHWLPVDFTTPAKTLADMAAGSVLGISVTYTADSEGHWDYEYPVETIPVEWEDWVNLPVREYDLAIRTVNRTIRVPHVVIARNYTKVPSIKPRLTRAAILERDNYTCQYTGRQYTASEARKYLNIDHVHPRSKGGATTWSNVVAASREINARKADKDPHEVGLALIKSPKEPRARPKALTDLMSGVTVNPGWLWILPKNDRVIHTT